MDELRETALAEYRREGPPDPLKWWVWLLVTLISGVISYVLVWGLKMLSEYL